MGDPTSSVLQRAGLTWVEKGTLRGADTEFAAVFDERSLDLQSTPERFVLMKSASMIEWYASRFAAEPPRRVLEVGIHKGGGVALFEELWHPRHLVAVDSDPRPLTALAEFIRRIGASERIHPEYGVDQSDRQAMRRVLTEHLGERPLDLIVDDGCHFLEETRALFNIAFPCLRPGGTYIIEDWAWAHWPGAWQEDGGPWRDKPALTSLALELAMLSASRGDLAKSVEITGAFIVVCRGASARVPEDFDLSSAYRAAGRVFLEAGFPAAGGAAPEAGGARAALAAEAARTAHLDAELRAVKDSTSWRVTAPMRDLGDFIRRRRRGG